MTDSTVRDHRNFLLHLHRVLAERGSSRPADLYDDVAARAGLTEEDREVRDSSSGQIVWKNRIQFARQSLIDAGVVVGPSDDGWQRGRWQISAEGKRLAEAHPEDEELEAILRTRAADGARVRAEARRESRALAGLDDGDGPTAEDPTVEAAEVSSLHEQINALDIIAEANEAVFSTMLEHLRAMDDHAFERLVGEVLCAALRGISFRATRRTRDGGVDGFVHFDSLGMRFAVYEAKKYADGNVVGRPLVDAFATAARRTRAAHALFVTTSHFSPEAKETGREEAIRLVDGTAFVELMAIHGIGLRKKETFTLYEVDPNWTFETSE